MKNDNKLFKFTAFILLITILALILVAGTYAKYTSSASGFDSARVAKWSFKVDGTDIAGTEEKEVAFNIFSTITNVDETEEKGVSVNDGSIIAPGTRGSFKIALENASEVAAKYTVEYSVENTESIPLEYSKDGTTWNKDITSIKQDYTELAIGAKEDTATVYWRWAFTGNDESKDTTLGTEGTATVKVTAKIVAEQVD